MNIEHETYELMKKYGRMMAQQAYPVGKARLFLTTEGGVYATEESAKVGELTEADVKKISAQDVPALSEEMKAVVISQTPFCQRCLAENQEFRAVLDDMAQIVGPKAVIVDGSGKPEHTKAAIKKAMKSATGCFVRTGADENGRGQGYTVTVGRNLYEAVVAMTVLEKSAEVALKCSVIGGGKPLSELEAKMMRNFYKQKYSKTEQAIKSEEGHEESAGATCQNTADACEKADADSADSREMQLRQLLVDYGKKLVECGLVQGTWGNLSIRLDEKYMLTTPSGLDYMRLTASDMVKVEIASLEYEGDKKPTSEKGLHAAVYQRRPEIGAVIHTHSKYCAIFAAANRDMPIEVEAGQKIFGTTVKLASYGLPGSKKLMKNTADALGKNFGCLMANHGMVAAGCDIETAFQNCQMLEACGKSYIDSRFV